MVQPPNAPEARPLGRESPPADWPQPPPSVRTLVLTLLKRLEAVEARLPQDATTSQRPPSTDSPYTKARKPAADAPRRKAGGAPRPSWSPPGSCGLNRDPRAHPTTLRVGPYS